MSVIILNLEIAIIKQSSIDIFPKLKLKTLIRIACDFEKLDLLKKTLISMRTNTLMHMIVNTCKLKLLFKLRSPKIKFLAYCAIVLNYQRFVSMSADKDKTQKPNCRFYLRFF